MSKKSNVKNIILTNLPAAAALLLMAAALKLTLQYSFFISLIILIVVYFLLGVTIELILEKLEARKKRENIFKQFSEGGRSNLPTDRSELYGEAETETEDSEDSDDYEEPVFPDEEPVEITEESVVETSEQEEIEVEAEEAVSVEEAELYVEEEGLSFSESLEEMSVSHDNTDKFSDFSNLFEESDPEDVFDFVAREEDEPVELSQPEEEIPVTQEEEEVITEPVVQEFTLDDIPTDETVFAESAVEEVVTEPVSEVDNVETKSEETNSYVDSFEESDELFDALKAVGAIPEAPVDETPLEEKEARRSLFDGNDFDAKTPSGSKPSVLFGSVPDTEDDLDYIPPAIDTSNTPKKGKVQVDSQKIDELYAFKKANAGESFFGKRRKK